MKRFIQLLIAACVLQFAAPVVTTTVESVLDVPACSISIDCALATDYGRTTVGASWVSAESRYSLRKITLGSTETATKMSAYLRSQGSATNGLKMVLYEATGDTLSYESSELAGFTDTTGAWRDFTFTSSVTAGTYWVGVVGDAIAGGANTVEVAYDAVASDTSTYQYAFYTGTWATMEADITANFGATGAGTHNISVYLQTSAGGASNAPRAKHHKRQLSQVIDLDSLRARQRPKLYCIEQRLAA